MPDSHCRALVFLVLTGCMMTSQSVTDAASMEEELYASRVSANPQCMVSLVSNVTCSQLVQRWSFSDVTGRCVLTFLCRTNVNNYDTKSQCDQTCVCYLPIYPSSCRGRIRRYGFDSNTGQCRMFIFKGCNPNGNNFDTLATCQATCGGTGTDDVSIATGTDTPIGRHSNNIITANGNNAVVYSMNNH